MYKITCVTADRNLKLLVDRHLILGRDSTGDDGEIKGSQRLIHALHHFVGVANRCESPIKPKAFRNADNDRCLDKMVQSREGEP